MYNLQKIKLTNPLNLKWVNITYKLTRYTECHKNQPATPAFCEQAKKFIMEKLKKKKRKQKWDLLTIIALDSKTAKINSG